MRNAERIPAETLGPVAERAEWSCASESHTASQMLATVRVRIAAVHQHHRKPHLDRCQGQRVQPQATGRLLQARSASASSLFSGFCATLALTCIACQVDHSQMTSLLES